MENSTLETVVGTIDKIVFFNKENSYTVARLIPKKGTLSITIIGYLPDLRAGERIQDQGRQEDNTKFGPQFRISTYEIIPPSSTEGIEKYLSSGLIKGLGPVMAERIVKRFGPDTLRVINEEPERLRVVHCIGRNTFKKIITSW